eukprot:Trichotokara_eunicae@DN620_c0_g1_i1.p1
MGATCTKSGDDGEAGGGTANAVVKARGAPMEDGLPAVVNLQKQIIKPGAPSLQTSSRIVIGDISINYAFDTNQILGTGFSGPVRLAVNKMTGRKYAVKMFKKQGKKKKKKKKKYSALI